MALTKISGSILKDPLNLGEVSIGGTLTYQDVTNVDSVGVITARSNIDCNGDLDVDGHTNLDNTSIVGIVTISAGTNNEGLRITGQNNNAVIFTSPSINSSAGYRLNHHPATNTLRVDTTDQNGTFSGIVASFSSAGLDMADNIKLRLGTSQDLTLYHYGNDAYIDNATGSILIRQGGSEKLRIKSDGMIQLASATANTIHTSSDASKISIFAGSTNSVSNGGVITVTGVNHSAGCFTDVSAGSGGHTQFRIGTSEKLRINSSGQIMIGDDTVGNSSNEKLIIQGMVTNADYEASIALRRGTTIGSNDAGLGYIKFQDSAGSTGASMGGRADSGWSASSRPTHLLFYTAQSGSNSPTERMRIHSGGSVTKPHMPLASYSDSRAVDISNAELTSSNFYNQTWVNQGNHFNASNGRFTCPVAGIYRIFFRATTDQTQHTNVRLRRNGSTINEAYANGTSGTTHSDSSEAIVNCSAGDYLHIQISRLKTSGGAQHKQVTFQLLH